MQREELRKHLETVEDQIAALASKFRERRAYVELMGRLRRRTVDEMNDNELNSLADSLIELRDLQDKLVIQFIYGGKGPTGDRLR